jgi:hypothetical protein
MDQYVVTIEMPILYFDLIELIHVMKESKNEYIEPYIDCLQEIVDKEIEK